MIRDIKYRPAKNRTFLFDMITKKTISSYYSNWYMKTRVLVLGVIAALTVLFSCKNNDEVFAVNKVTYLNVVNASPNVLNFYLNGTRQNNASSLYPGSQSYYQQVPAGVENYQFKQPQSSTVLFTVPLTLKDSVNNTLYVTGETAGGTFYTVDFLDTSGISNSLVYAKMRFVNAAPNSGTLSVAVDDTSRFTQSPFKSTTAFLKILSGSRVMKIYQAGATIPTVDTAITIQPGHMYTLYSRSTSNSAAATGFGVGVALNY